MWRKSFKSWAERKWCWRRSPAPRRWRETLGGLGINGKLVVLGAAADPLPLPLLDLLLKRRSIQGWPAGASIDSEDTMKFAVLTAVRPMIEIYPLERAAEGYERMMSGRARFRAVLSTGQ